MINATEKSYLEGNLHAICSSASHARFGLFFMLAGCGSVNTNPDAADIDASAFDGGSLPIDASAIDGGAPPDAAPCVPAPAGLRARWRGEMNTGDDTGIYDGSSVGGVAYAAGRHGSAFRFDGVDDIVTADAGDALYPTASFSLEAWVSTFSSNAAIFQKYDCGGSDACGYPYWDLYIDPEGHAQFWFRVNGGPTSSLVTSPEPINDGDWHHLVGVRDVGSAQQVLYVDGVVAASSMIGGVHLGPLTNEDGLPDVATIGGGRKAGIDTYVARLLGMVDEVSYYESAMSAAEVAAIYGAPDGICP